MVSTEKRAPAKPERRQKPARQKTQVEMQTLRAMVMRMRREHADLKREVATILAEVSGTLRPIDGSFDEHDRQVMQEVQEGIAACYRKSSTTVLPGVQRD